MADSSPLDRFVRAFVLPLVAGGRVYVRGLVGPGMLAKFYSGPPLEAGLSTDLEREVRAQLQRLGPVTTGVLMPRDALALAAVWHNLLAMTHPDVVGRKRLRRRVRAWTLRMLEWIGAPKQTRETAYRHGVLARLGELGRVDSDVVSWAFTAKFIGVAPPRSMLLWPRIRRIRETRSRVTFFDLLHELHDVAPDADLLEPARAALALSPLTDVALADRPSSVAPFTWTGASVNALGDVPMRGAVVRLALRDSHPSTETGHASPGSPRLRAIEHATRDVAEQVPPAAADVLVRFHLELLVTDALARGSAPPGHTLGWDALARLGAERASTLVGIERERFDHVLALDAKPRAPLKDAPSRPLLARAGFSEVAS